MIDYNFLMMPDTMIVLTVSLCVIMASLLFINIDGILSKIMIILVTTALVLWIPVHFLDEAVQNDTMYDNYRHSISNDLKNEFSEDYYKHIDENGELDDYAFKIKLGMSRVNDKVATIGHKYGFGIPNEPGFELLNTRVSRKYLALLLTSIYYLWFIPLLSLAFYGVIIYGLAIYAEKTVRLYPLEKRKRTYKVLMDKINDAKNEIQSIEYEKEVTEKEAQAEIRNIQLKQQKKELEYKKKCKEMDEEIAEKEMHLEKLNKEISEKVAQSSFFDSD